MNSLPHRFRETSVSKFERQIAQAVAKWPTAVQFDPRPLAPTTWVARFRDACISLHKHQWTLTSLIDMEKFNQVYGEDQDLVVSERVEGVFVGSTASLKPSTPLAAGRDADKPNKLIVHEPTNNEVLALAQLCAGRRLPNILLPVRLIGAIDPVLISRIEDSFDVSFSQQPDGSYDLV